MAKAVFLDRDGVINRLVLNRLTGEYESPHREEELKIYSWSLGALDKLSKSGYLLFLVSNQPSYAKGKAPLKKLKKVHAKLHRTLLKHGIRFRQYYYCFHHPEGIVPRYAIKCPCRKPSPVFLLKAKKKYALEMKHSWMVGDRDIDVACGKRAGTRTILIRGGQEKPVLKKKVKPDFSAKNLKEAVQIILSEE